MSYGDGQSKAVVGRFLRGCEMKTRRKQRKQRAKDVARKARRADIRAQREALSARVLALSESRSNAEFES